MNGKGRMLMITAAGLVAAFFISAAALLVSAFLLWKFQADTGSAKLVIAAVYGLSCLAGGWVSGKKASRRKFVWGLAIGTFYFLILFLISSLEKGHLQPEITSSFLAFMVCSVGGMLGGMLA